MPEIKYSDNPNEETAFVETDDGQRNRAVLTVAVDGEIEFPANPNSTKVSVSVDGVKRKAIAVATIAGSGGGDAHNKGYFATLAELQEAYPTGEAGDWAIVAESDTVYIWDDTQQAWVDTDQKGQVTSVNNQTGAVVLGAQDVSAVPQYSTMPQASEDELGNIYQFTGTTDANYTNGYFYKCVSDGGNPATYSWSQVSVQPAPSGLPDQTGQSGKFLTTDGTDASWSDKPLVNNTTQTNSLAILGTTTKTEDVVIGVGAVGGDFGRGPNVVVGQGAKASVGGIAIGSNANAGSMSGSGYDSIAIGSSSSAKGTHSIQLGSGDFPVTNNDANTFKVANANGNYEMMSADGTVPADRLVKVATQYSTVPTADSTNLGKIIQYTGATDSTYTNGYFYKCVSDGQDPATYSWTAVQVQASSGGLPDQTGQSGKFLTTDGTDASWATINALQNTATATNSLTILGTANTTRNDSINIGSGSLCVQTGAVCIGYNAQTGVNAVSIGSGSTAVAMSGVSIGYKTIASAFYSIQIGGGKSGYTNSNRDTVKFGNSNGNFEIMSADGTIPAARHASLPATDGTYVLKLVIASGVPTLSWVAE